MTPTIKELIDRLARTGHLEEAAYEHLIRGRSPSAAAYLRERAASVRDAVFGRAVYIRGLIEVSSFCRNNCLYCGIRCGNRAAGRYRLTDETILMRCRTGYGLGFRTFVLQGGEDPAFTDERLIPLIRQIKAECPGSAVTLSLGERSEGSYRALFEAGAVRYLLRHETADRAHYETLHPKEMSFDRRMQCLRSLRAIGYQTGCGFMVGSPGQTPRHLAEDLAFIEAFRPHMCGIGPFIPHRDTPFAACPAGDIGLTTYLLSILRLMMPEVLLPSTTALATLDPAGREAGLNAGANVIMPNLTPADVRPLYSLYNGKVSEGTEDAERLKALSLQLEKAGYHIVTDRGDHPGVNR